MYIKRIIDKLLELKLEGSGAVLIEGPKGCGKTTSGKNAANSLLMLESNDNKQYLMISQMNPRILLKGKTPRLIDEWQIAPNLWDTIRFEVDHRKDMSQFIMTSSTQNYDKTNITHTGTGRIKPIFMRPMSLYESKDSTGDVSLLDLFNNPKTISGKANIDIKKLSYLICRGGWPEIIINNRTSYKKYNEEYLNDIINNRINGQNKTKKNSKKLSEFMRSYAKYQSRNISNYKIIKDICIASNDKLNNKTISSYIDSLKKIYILEELPYWNPYFQQKTIIKKKNMCYFVDPSIAVTALNIDQKGLFSNNDLFESLLKILCIRDIRTYTESINGNIYHYEDKTDLKCDVIVKLRGNKYGLLNIVLGNNDSNILKAANSLLFLRNKLNIEYMKEPSFMTVITGIGGCAYKLNDNIFVIPIGCLKD